jgi:hypothetical protein
MTSTSIGWQSVGRKGSIDNVIAATFGQVHPTPMTDSAIHLAPWLVLNHLLPGSVHYRLDLVAAKGKSRVQVDLVQLFRAAVLMPKVRRVEPDPK